jgi:HEPN domain-containing protein
MKPLTREWIEKAEEDFAAAERLAPVRKPPIWNVLCFHCQQCIEKYLKACLQEKGRDIPKTHNLALLLDLLLPEEPLWEALRHSLNLLNGFAVEFRYPGESATSQDARNAMVLCKKLRTTFRESLMLRGNETKKSRSH